MLGTRAIYRSAAAKHLAHGSGMLSRRHWPRLAGRFEQSRSPFHAQSSSLCDSASSRTIFEPGSSPRAVGNGRNCWQDEVARLMESAWSSSSPGKSYAREACDSKKETVTSGGALRIDVLRRLPLALQRRLVRSAAELLGLRLEFQHVREILRLSESGPKSGPKSAPLPHDWKVVRTGEELRFQPPLAGETEDAPTEYEYSLCVPGRVEVSETSSMFEAVAVGMGNSMAGYNPDHLFDPAALSKELQVRNWRPGDRFWPAHTKCPKKIKELLQTHHITLEERKLWPVVVSGEEIVWVRGFPAARRFLPKGNAREAMLIREVPLASV